MPTQPPDSAPTLCVHLEPIRLRLLGLGASQSAILKIWSGANNFAVFDAILDRPAIRAALPLPACVIDHDHLGTHDGSESGFACTLCRDGVVGLHPQRAPANARTFG